MMVKICGITNVDDAMAAIDGGATALGFNFYPASPRYIAPDRAAEIIAALPASVWKVGIFVNSPDSIHRIARHAGLDIVQLHGQESPADSPSDIRIWKAIRFSGGSPETIATPWLPIAEAILLDGPFSGESFDWSRIPPIPAKLILAGGLDAGNVQRAIAQVRPWGVDACSRIEISPGRKDHPKMAAFLKAAFSA